MGPWATPWCGRESAQSPLSLEWRGDGSHPHNAPLLPAVATRSTPPARSSSCVCASWKQNRDGGQILQMQVSYLISRVGSRTLRASGFSGLVVLRLRLPVEVAKSFSHNSQPLDSTPLHLLIQWHSHLSCLSYIFSLPPVLSLFNHLIPLMHCVCWPFNDWFLWLFSLFCFLFFC